MLGLESNQYKCCIHSRDWSPGRPIPDQIFESVDSSRRTIIVLSRNYLNSVWSNLEFRSAHHIGMKQNIQVKTYFAVKLIMSI